MPLPPPVEPAASRGSRRRKHLITAALVAPFLVAGTVGIGALTTFHTSVDDNTSTVHGEYVPKPSLEITGDPFALVFHPDATTTGSAPTPFVITNTGDAAGTWDAVLAAAADTDPEVAAITEITASVHLYTPNYATNSPNYRSGTWEFSLGTLADPVPLITQVETWQRSAGLVQADQGSVNAKALALTGASLAPGESVTVTVRPRYTSAAAAKEIADAMAEGETRVATSDLRVTYLPS